MFNVDWSSIYDLYLFPEYFTVRSNVHVVNLKSDTILIKKYLSSWYNCKSWRISKMFSSLYPCMYKGMKPTQCMLYKSLNCCLFQGAWQQVGSRNGQGERPAALPGGGDHWRAGGFCGGPRGCLTKVLQGGCQTFSRR